MQVELHERKHNSVALQFEVEDVKACLDYVDSNGGTITSPATFSEKDNFWFASLADPEGNSHWVVDGNCP